MDKIYSRKRVKIPKIKGFYRTNKNAKKFFSIFIIIFFSFITFFTIIKSVGPVFDNIVLQNATLECSNIIGNACVKVLENMDYSNILVIEKNEKNGIIKTDVATINKVMNSLAIAAEEELKKLNDFQIKIPVGELTGIKYLSGFGPKINLKIHSIGNIDTQIENDFESKGINQTVYKIYAKLGCKINVITPYKTIEGKAEKEILLVETVILGNVPEAYYNLEKESQSN